MTRQGYAPFPLALGRPIDRQEYGCVVSEEPTEARTCAESGRRFDIEEHCWDAHAHGFPLASSRLRAVEALARRCCLPARTTLSLVAQGPEVVTQDKRRGGDPHWFRDQSYRKIGWNCVKLSVRKGYDLITSCHVSPAADPVSAIASKNQSQEYVQLIIALEF